MARNTLTVGLTRRSIREVLNFAGFDCPVGDRPELQDKEPLTETNLMIVLKDEMDEVFSGLLRRTEFALKAQVRKLTRQELSRVLSEKGQGKKDPAEGELEGLRQELERLRQKPEQILCDVVDNVSEIVWQLKALATLIGTGEAISELATANHSGELAYGLGTVFQTLLDKQQAILDTAWDKCKGREPESGD